MDELFASLQLKLYLNQLQQGYNALRVNIKKEGDFASKHYFLAQKVAHVIISGDNSDKCYIFLRGWSFITEQ